MPLIMNCNVSACPSTETFDAERVEPHHRCIPVLVRVGRHQPQRHAPDQRRREFLQDVGDPYYGMGVVLSGWMHGWDSISQRFGR